ncbi:MAG: 50S ribosomal protein L21 [Elusimicrobiaceae bacterium]|nr:50S ribosomal protein L21 [Elusimicrobiaceae bacterium]
MYAIIETGGKQYWVTPGEKVRVEKLIGSEGDDVEISALWSAAGDSKEEVSGKQLPKAKVLARIIRHLRAPKVIAFKRRPKKAYEKTIGHRQDLTEIEIKDIQLS